MAVKRLKVRRKNIPYLKCAFRVYPNEFVGAEILVRYKDKGICRVVPVIFHDVMNETGFDEIVLSHVKKAFLQLKEITNDAK